MVWIWGYFPPNVNYFGSMASGSFWSKWGNSHSMLQPQGVLMSTWKMSLHNLQLMTQTWLLPVQCLSYAGGCCECAHLCLCDTYQIKVGSGGGLWNKHLGASRHSFWRKKRYKTQKFVFKGKLLKILNKWTVFNCTQSIYLSIYLHIINTVY